ncbi:hypothetical protein GCM10009527_005720 [Actinomadura nitritigenes]
MWSMTGGSPSVDGFGGVHVPGFGVAHCWSASTEESCVRMDGPEEPPASARTTGQPPAAAPTTPAVTIAITGVFPRIGRVLHSVGGSVLVVRFG